MLRRLIKNAVDRNLARRSPLGTGAGYAAFHGGNGLSQHKGLAERIVPRGVLPRAPYKLFGCPLSTGAVSLGTKELVSGGNVAQKAVSRWLYVCSGWVFGMVVLGGMTRLTRSGLSMTDWKFTGSLPPLSAEEWEKEFDKYRQSPEYRTVNKGMSLDEFKFIYWMEYAHRMSGRALGVVFALPFGYFLVKGYITRELGARLGVLLAMGAGQGLVGWWMVKSGLEEPATEGGHARVSPYRLATHLASAFVIYSGLLWTALSVASPSPPSPHLPQVVLQSMARMRRLVLPVSGLVGLTALSGAFVAGNDAGRAFNTFPKMGDDWIPEGILALQPTIKNFFENTATVQFNHRVLATTTLLSIGAVWLASRGLALPGPASKLITGAVHMTLLQVSLGVYALLSYVPVHAGVAHQAGALTLFTIMVALAHTLRRPFRGVTETTRLMNRLGQI
ncbi:cytochrome c oxidase assembly protein COX15 [Selaginella moellendorffii]|uniref:cytochrome c oxidase assembly protein COX15 n=1 Tax=Selaginella moellendorffii TaxID=88036 RepID=UPI000D1CDC3C|nr:cytochrome c oxidase assembly protein COX15 [Selaginella moellendorffii]|eukprot:XP_002986506.2 cytochrome c oxidase assembly protein COX15 [Selaginella moellendorffii]